jgi:hypothetical protein
MTDNDNQRPINNIPPAQLITDPEIWEDAARRASEPGKRPIKELLSEALAVDSTGIVPLYPADVESSRLMRVWHVNGRLWAASEEPSTSTPAQIDTGKIVVAMDHDTHLPVVVCIPAEPDALNNVRSLIGEELFTAWTNVLEHRRAPRLVAWPVANATRIAQRAGRSAPDGDVTILMHDAERDAITMRVWLVSGRLWAAAIDDPPTEMPMEVDTGDMVVDVDPSGRVLLVSVQAQRSAITAVRDQIGDQLHDAWSSLLDGTPTTRLIFWPIDNSALVAAAVDAALRSDPDLAVVGEVMCEIEILLRSEILTGAGARGGRGGGSIARTYTVPAEICERLKILPTIEVIESARHVVVYITPLGHRPATAVLLDLVGTTGSDCHHLLEIDDQWSVQFSTEAIGVGPHRLRIIAP